jgi:dihydrofolate reductase
MGLADRLDITEVHATPQGDCFLDKPDPKQWRETARADHKATAADSSDFSFTTYMRV